MSDVYTALHETMWEQLRRQYYDEFVLKIIFKTYFEILFRLRVLQ